MNAKKLKMIGTRRYEIELYEAVDGQYYIQYAVGSRATVSERIRDLNMALYLFDLKLSDLEGEA